MSDIIEKLGITPITVFEEYALSEIEKGSGDSYSYLIWSEERFREMLGSLIGDVLKAEKNWLDNWLDPLDLDPLTTDQEIIQKCQEANKDKISIIEKACYPKTWNEIKELLK